MNPARTFGALACLCALPFASQADWPQFRGPQASGQTTGEAAPVTWNVQTGENILWRAEVPGLGHSAPIIVGDRVFVTSAVNESGKAELKVGLYGDIGAAQDNGKQKWVLLCFDRRTGTNLWEQVAHEGLPAIKRHTKATHANSTPASDGHRVVAFFGNEGLHCYTVEGKPVWKKSLGRLDAGYYKSPSAQWGFASSPVIEDGRVLVQCDVQTNSFIAAFDLADGRELWRTARLEVPTWCTPTVTGAGGKKIILINGYKHTGAYDFATGKEIWKLSGGGDIPVPTPIVAHGLAFFTSAHGPSSPIYAIRPEAKGDLTLPSGVTTNAGIVWSVPRKGNYMQTPIVVGDLLYCCNDAGTLSCYDARSGKLHFQERISPTADGYTASPVASHGRIYFASEQGRVRVLQAVTSFKVEATNDLGETCMATPAVSDGVLFFRTRSQLIAVGTKPVR